MVGFEYLLVKSHACGLEYSKWGHGWVGGVVDCGCNGAAVVRKAFGDMIFDAFVHSIFELSEHIAVNNCVQVAINGDNSVFVCGSRDLSHNLSCDDVQLCVVSCRVCICVHFDLQDRSREVVQPGVSRGEGRLEAVEALFDLSRVLVVAVNIASWFATAAFRF